MIKKVQSDYLEFLKEGFLRYGKKLSSNPDLVIHLFGELYFEQVLKRLSGGGASLKEAKMRLDEIQRGLEKGLSDKDLLKGHHVQKWFQGMSGFCTERPEVLLTKEKVRSYRLLVFPFQETSVQAKRYDEYLKELELASIHGAHSLFHFLESALIEENHLFFVHVVLFKHSALIDHQGNKISWLALLCEWAGTDQKRRDLLIKLLKRLETTLPIEMNSLLKFSEMEPAVEDFRTFVARKTLQEFELRLNVQMDNQAKQLLLEHLKLSESLRLDLSYFSTHEQDLLHLSFIQERDTYDWLQRLKLFFRYHSTSKEASSLFHFLFFQSFKRECLDRNYRLELFCALFAALQPTKKMCQWLFDAIFLEPHLPKISCELSKLAGGASDALDLTQTLTSILQAQEKSLSLFFFFLERGALTSELAKVPSEILKEWFLGFSLEEMQKCLTDNSIKSLQKAENLKKSLSFEQIKALGAFRVTRWMPAFTFLELMDVENGPELFQFLSARPDIRGGLLIDAEECQCKLKKERFSLFASFLHTFQISKTEEISKVFRVCFVETLKCNKVIQGKQLCQAGTFSLLEKFEEIVIDKAQLFNLLCFFATEPKTPSLNTLSAEWLKILFEGFKVAQVEDFIASYTVSELLQFPTNVGNLIQTLAQRGIIFTAEKKKELQQLRERQSLRNFKLIAQLSEHIVVDPSWAFDFLRGKPILSRGMLQFFDTIATSSAQEAFEKIGKWRQEMLVSLTPSNNDRFERASVAMSNALIKKYAPEFSAEGQKEEKD